MGDLLGARYDDRELLFDDGKVNFRKVQETKPFQDGVTRLALQLVLKKGIVSL